MRASGFLLAAALFWVFGEGTAWPQTLPLVGHFTVDNGPITNLAWSPDGIHMAYCGAPGCRIVLASSGKVSAVIPDTVTLTTGLGPGNMAFSADGMLLFLPAEMARPGEFMSVWNSATGAPAGQIAGPPAGLSKGSTSMGLLAASADHHRLLAVLSGFGVPGMVFDLPGRQAQRVVIPPPGEDFEAISLSPDGRVFAAAEDADAVRFYDANAGTELGRLPVPASVSATAFSPDGRFFAAGFRNGGAAADAGSLKTPIYLWPLKNRLPHGAPRKLCGAQAQGVRTMLWQAGSRAVIYDDGDGKTAICPVDGGAEIVVQRRADDALGYLALSPDGRDLAVGADGRVDVFLMPGKNQAGE